MQNPDLTEQFLDDVKKFTDFGTTTRLWNDDGIPYMANEFWTSSQRKSHPLHEISYRACFKAQLPGFFIDRLTKIGDGVLDPFMGRGTTPLQAALSGRMPIGNDINPLSAILLEPRLNPPSLNQIGQRLQEIPIEKGIIERDDLSVFFGKQTLRDIHGLRSWLLQREASGSIDIVDKWIRMVAINRLTGHSIGYLSGRTLPPNQAVSIRSQAKINIRNNIQEQPEKNVRSVILKKSQSLLKQGNPLLHPPAILSTGLARNIHILPDSSVTLVVTSPPFLDIVDYAGDNWLRCWFAGIDISNVSIDIHKGIQAWKIMVKEVLIEMARVLVPGGHIAFEVGEVRKGTIMLEKLVWEAACGLPYEKLAIIINEQNFTKTANMWGVDNNSKGTNTNRIVLLRRV
jgi:DNA methylase